MNFAGGLICISNLELHPAPLAQALKSRVHYLHYDPTDEQLAALMLDIAKVGSKVGQRWPPPAQCQKVARYLIAESKRLGCRLDLRLLVDKAFPDYHQYRSGRTEVHWKDLITATLKEQLVELRHTPVLRSTTRREGKLSEQRIIRELLTKQPSKPARLAAWKKQTGKSARAYYPRLRELNGLAG